MKGGGYKTWLVVVGTLVIFFSIGAVAWAVTDDGTCAGDGLRSGRGPGAMQEWRGERWERQAALYDALRDDMSPEDQVTYDELVAAVEEQRAALQQAREELKNTLKELRTLVDGYLDLDGGTGTD
jgi:hypothetical protein